MPLLVFGLWGGAIADTVDRRKCCWSATPGVALTSALLWLQAFAGLGSVWVVLVLLGVQQAFFAVNMPTRAAAIARLVPADLLPSANALGSTVAQFGMVLGPLLAGALLPVLGLSTLYLVDALALCLTMWAVWRLPPIPPLNGPQRRAGLRDVSTGSGTWARRKVLLVSFLADIIAMVAGMPRALFPEMAERTFGDPPGGGLALGVLYAAVPVGRAAVRHLVGLAVAGAPAGRRGRRGGVRVGRRRWPGFGLAPMLWLAVVFLALGGAADMASMVYRSAILQDGGDRRDARPHAGRVHGRRRRRPAHRRPGARLDRGSGGHRGGSGRRRRPAWCLAVSRRCAVPVFWRYLAPPRQPEPPALSADDAARPHRGPTGASHPVRTHQPCRKLRPRACHDRQSPHTTGVIHPRICAHVLRKHEHPAGNNPRI